LVVAALAACWAVLDRWTPEGTGWLPGIASALLVVIAFAQVATHPQVSRPARRRWRRLTWAAGLAGVALAVRATDALLSEVDLRIATGALFLAAGVPLARAVHRFPLGARTPAERTRLRLDVVTLALSVALLWWYLAVRPEARAGFDPLTLAAPLAGAVAVILAVRRAQYADQMRVGLRRSAGPLPFLALLAVTAAVVLALPGPIPDLIILAAGTVALAVLVAVRQVLARREAARLADALAAAGRQYADFVRDPAEAVLICDSIGRVRYATPALGSLLGVPPVALVGRPAWAVAHSEEISHVRACWTKVLGDPGGTAGHATRIGGAGGWRWVRVAYTNLLHDPAAGAMVITVRPITAPTGEPDQPTAAGLVDRSLFDEEAERAMTAPGDRERAGSGAGTSVALVDLDDFTMIDVALGRAAGDALLMAVAERLRACVRPGDLVARLSEDEFVVLLAGIQPEAVDAVAGRMLAALAEPIGLAGDEPVVVAASIGFADARPGEGPRQVLARATEAMRRAKAAGKGRYARH
jgi:diguanylate cyclase (GGDEF)-like protein/PAS domain S-box-containing protein